MKTSLLSFRAINVSSLGTLLVVAGCAGVPMRQSTVGFEMESIPAVANVRIPGYEGPHALQTVTPEFPWEMRRWGIPGEVDLALVIDETGRVVDARVARSTAPEYNAGALQAVKQWTFQPASHYGVAYASTVIQPILFDFSN